MKYDLFKNAVCSLLALCALTMHATNLFEGHWNEMQLYYAEMSTLEKFNLQHIYNHPYWLTTRQHIKKIVEGPANGNFLYDSILQNAMVRTQVNAMQNYELFYLQSIISEESKKRISLFKETLFGNLPLEIVPLNCTTNSLGHLYYAARVFEACRHTPIKTIMEFGSRYGNLARVLKMAIPESTLILIDFPELLALQYVYLSSSLPDSKIIVHTKIPSEFSSGAIHLLPVFLIEKLNVTVDCFISTFALSESTGIIQKIVLAKKFFNASVCYLAGQIAGWGTFNFVNHDLLFNGVRAIYKNVIAEPYHSLSTNFISDLPSYELLATTPLKESDKDEL